MANIRLDVQVQTTGADQIKTLSGNLEGLAATAKSAAKTLIGTFATKEFLDFATDSVKAFSDSEKAWNSLAQSFASQGNLTNNLVGQLHELADALAEVTEFDDDAIAGAMGVLANMGATGGDIEKLTKDILNLAAATGQDLSAAAETVGRALNGNMRGFKALGIEIDSTKPKVDAIHEALQRFAGQAELSAQTAAGQWKQVTNAFGEVQEGIGKLIVEFLRLDQVGGAAGTLRSIADFFGVTLVKALYNARAAFAEFMAMFFDGLGKIADANAALPSWLGGGGSGGAAMRLAAEDQRKFAFELRQAGEAAAAGGKQIEGMTNATYKNTRASNAAAAAAEKEEQRLKKLALAYADARKDAEQYFDLVQSRANQQLGQDIFGSQAVSTIGSMLGDEKFGSVTVAAEDMEKAVQGYRDALIQGSVAQDKAVIASQKHNAELEKSKKITFDWKQELQTLANLAQTLPGVFGQAFGQILSGVAGIGGAIDKLKGLDAGQGGIMGALTGKQGIGNLLGGLGQIGVIAGSVIGIGKAIGSAFGIGGDKAIMELNDIRDAFLETHGGFIGLQEKLVGLTDQDLVKKIFDADSVEEFNAAVSEVTSLLDLQGASQQALNDAVDRYGFTIEQLGPKFRQQEMDAQAQQLLQDFRLLTASGIDTTLVIEKMGPALSEFVQTSIAAGTAVPAAMKPMIDQFIQSGQLLDENGNAFASAEAAGITFAETMTESVSRMIESIDRLVSALTGIPNISREVTVHTNYTGGEFPGGGGGEDFGGGREFQRGIERVPRGPMRGGGLPAVLHPDEAVLNKAQAREWRAGGGSGGGNLTANIAPVFNMGQGAPDDKFKRQVLAELERTVRLGMGNLSHEIKRRGKAA